MATPLKEFFAQWKQLKPGAFTAGLETKIPLDYNVAMKGLSQIGREFPALSESGFDEQKKRFILRNTEADTDKQFFFRLIGSKSLEFAWGPLVEFDFQSQMVKIFNNIQDGFGLHPINVEFIDLKFYVRSEWEGHHYKAILETFLSNTPLGVLFEPKYLLQDDLFLRGILDDARICIIRVESNVSDSEVRSGKFENDILRAHVGVAQTRKIPINARIADVFMEHSEVAINFMGEKFIPHIVEPLDKTLVKLSGKG